MSEALIWGASGRIGNTLVERLSNNQWLVFAAARDMASVSPSARKVYHFYAADPNSFREISIDLVSETKGLDLVVYAAGGLQANLIQKMDSQAWSEVLDANLNGAFLAATHSIPLLNEGGQMIFIGGYVDHLLLPKMGAYAAAKAALEPLVQVLRKEQRKLRFSIVRPGAVDTPFWESAPFKLPANAKTPQRIAETILSHYTTGLNEDLNL